MNTAILSPHTEGRLQLIPRRILMVDEDRKDLIYYSSLLQQQGYDVSTCASYDEGSLRLKGQAFDFVVVGQGSRAFEGRFVVEDAIAMDRRMPVLVLTKCLDMGCYLEAMQLGAVDYLEKPVSPAEMARVVETHLRPRSMVARVAGAA